MKKIILFLITLSIVMSCKNEGQKERNILVNYPETKKVDTVTDYFGTEVKDPYRWLEDDISEETDDWVKDKMK